MSAPHEGDKSAAFSGLILGGIAIFVIVFAIVRITNATYASEHATEESAASPPAAVAPASSAPAAPVTVPATVPAAHP